MKTNISPVYPCAQKDLYAIASAAWHSFLAHQPAFSSHRAYYSVAYAEEALAEIAAAKALPDLQARTSPAEVARIRLVDQGAECRHLWQGIKLYIEKAFPLAEHTIRFDEAGQQYYRSASKECWKNVEALLDSGMNFLTLHEAALLNELNMPVDFAARFYAAKEAFELQYYAFLEMEITSVQHTAEKITANNLLYKKLTSMLADGKYIFKNKPGILYRFIFTRISALISNPTPSQGLQTGQATTESKALLKEDPPVLGNRIVSIPIRHLPKKRKPYTRGKTLRTIKKKQHRRALSLVSGRV